MEARFQRGGPCDRILSVSSFADERLILRVLFESGPGSFAEAQNCAEAAAVLASTPVGVVLCDECLSDGGWKDVLNLTAGIDNPPPLIVMSRLADDYLWAEVLDCGGYNVMSKPVDRNELSRVVRLACREHYETSSHFQRDTVPARAVGAVAGDRL
jgi:DNA-binding NtrC family response regulator